MTRQIYFSIKKNKRAIHVVEARARKSGIVRGSLLKLPQYKTWIGIYTFIPHAYR